MPVPIYVVDAFTTEAFRGNPAGVCILPAPAPVSWMQSVAAEMKHAETAFVSPAEDGYQLRWFTPTEEVELCGHATLASAHVLWSTHRLRHDAPARFLTRVHGILTCRNVEGRVTMDFPAVPTQPHPKPPGFDSALGSPVTAFESNGMDYLAELEDATAVRDLEPDLAAIAALGLRGLIVTARGRDYDFVSRFFAPNFGVPEDSVTGSAHCALAPYWAPRLGKEALVGYQASERGGIVGVQLMGDRCILSGSAITVLQGDWLIDY